MQRLLIFLTFALLANVQADIKKTLGLEKRDTIVIGGDSITAAQMHADYLAAWLQLTYPELDLATYVIARSGSSIRGWATAPPVPPRSSSEGLWERYCEPFDRLDHVFLMHGQNGGQGAEAHVKSYQDLWERWVSQHRSRPNLIMLGMHSTQTATDRKGAGSKAAKEAVFASKHPKRFASNTDQFFGAAWRRNSTNRIDVRQQKAEPFHGSKDVVHPGPAGHIAMTWSYLQGLGAETLVSSTTLDAESGKVSKHQRCKISKVKVGEDYLVFDRLDERLPWAIDEVGRANATALIPRIEGWQHFMVTVGGLKNGRYDIKIDGIAVKTATAVELANGINLADVTTGPIWEQGQEVLNKLRLLAGYDPASGDSLKGKADDGTLKEFHAYALIHYQNGNKRGEDYVTAMAKSLQSLSAKLSAVHEAAQPVTRTWRIERQAR